MCKSTYFEHQLASHGGAFTSPEVEGVGITKNGIYKLYIVIYDHCILIITYVNCIADLNQTYRSDPESDVFYYWSVSFAPWAFLSKRRVQSS